MDGAAISFKGRGTASNPPNRFEEIHFERDAEWNPEEDAAPRTVFLRDASQTAINFNNSPDVGFEASINPYRGCEHGCIYCFARPTHEYLGFSSGLDFETKIMVKENLPELLRKELSAKKWKPQTIVMSGVTDCYQPIERKLKLTRRCLEVLTEFRNPVGIITKNFLVTRDVDLYAELARHNAVRVNISITTLDETLTPKLEPRAALPKHRLAAVKILSDAGVFVNVMVAPVIPAITDFEMPKIIQAARDVGAKSVGYLPLRLPYAVSSLFEQWLEMHFPDRKEKVLNQIRALRGGKLNDPNFGSRMRGEGIFAEQMNQIFHVACRKAGFDKIEQPEISTAAFRIPAGAQLTLF